MKYLGNFNDFGALEKKLWYNTIPQFLGWVKSKSFKTFIFLDTETTGLGGPRKQQLTQVSAIATKWDKSNNSFKELDSFDEKIKLSDETKSKYNDEGDNTKWVLSFNHYGSGNYKYKDEQKVINDFLSWIDTFDNPFLIAQNAPFDMSMLGGRFGNKIKGEVFDTKELIQLYYLPALQKLSETDDKFKEIVDFIGTSDRDGGIISSSMSKVGPALGIDMSGYHDALTDCRITIEMFKKLYDFLNNNSDLDITQYQNERIRIKRKN